MSLKLYRNNWSALNAIKTDEIKSDKKMKSRYLSVIDEENKRMNKQVENVLKISQLDSSKISLIKNDIDVHSVIHEANKRISLLLNINNGKINLDFKAENSIIKLSFEELTKVFVNLLENSINILLTIQKSQSKQEIITKN